MMKRFRMGRRGEDWGHGFRSGRNGVETLGRSGLSKELRVSEERGWV